MISLKFKLTIFILISLSFVFLLINQMFACGPFFPNYIYTPEDIEIRDNPFLFIEIDSLLDSKYGVISSGWCSQSLYPVYMDLINAELTQEEKEQLSRYYDGDFYGISASLGDAVASWLAARTLVTDKKVEIGQYKCENYSCYTNCLPDAFLTATETLKDRLEIYNSEEMKIWLESQDKVFANCAGKEGVGVTTNFLVASVNASNNQGFFSKIQDFFSRILNKIIDFIKGLFEKEPVELKEEINTQDLLKHDQEYQEAAAAFYKEEFDEAEKQFKEISNNQNHPWRDYAALALGRTYIRKGQFAYAQDWWSQDEETIQFRNSQLEKAKVQFENILKDESLSLVHNAAKSLINYVNFRIDFKERLKDAEEVLLTSHDPKQIVNNLEDFSSIFYKWQYQIDDKFILENGKDLSQWIYFWKNSEQNNLDFSFKKYQETNSIPWLLLSLKLLKTDYAQKDEIIEKSLEIPESSSAYLTANYYRLKFLIETEENKEEIRKNIDDILKTINPEEFPLANNYFNDLRMIATEDLEEALSYSLRKIAAVIYDFSSKSTDDTYLIDKKTKQLFNEFLPLAKWSEIASNNNIFPPEITKQIRLTAFVRAILLDDFETAEKIANLLSNTDSTLKQDLSDFLETTSQEEKKFTAALFMLKYPRLNYVLDSSLDEALVQKHSLKEKDIYQRNWWCGYPGYAYSYDLKILKKLISLEEIEEAKTENEKIYKIIAPNYLSETVINYAIGNINDSRIPEALHLSVKATRSAKCKDEETTNFSRRAFQTLHNNYPNNYWTNQTPYWY